MVRIPRREISPERDYTRSIMRGNALRLKARPQTHSIQLDVGAGPESSAGAAEASTLAAE